MFLKKSKVPWKLFPGNQNLQKKLLDDSPGTSPHEKFGKENVRQLKRILYSISIKSP